MTRARAAVLGAVAAGLWLLLGLWQAPRLGLHVDEASYLTADIERMPWFAAAQQGNPAAWQPDILHSYWRYTVFDCHPFLLRLLTGLALATAGGAGDGIPLAWRLPNIVIGALATGMLTAVAARLWGLAGGLGGLAALLASPRLLAYAFLATHDPTVTFLGVLAALSVWAWLPTGRGWLIVPAVFLMFAAKINALPLAAGLLVWAGLAHGQRLMLRLAGLLFLAGGLYLAVEPQFWLDRWTGMREMLDHHLLHRTYPLQVLGRVVADGRNEVLYPLLQFITAIPLAQLGLAGLGLLRRRPASTGSGRLLLLAAVQVLACLLPAMLPGTPKYGGIRVYLLPAFPFLALLVACGAGCAWQWSKRLSWRLLLVVVLFLPLLDFARLQPHAALYANALVGGAEGSWQLGNETFAELMHLSPAMAADIARQMPEDGRLFITPYSPYIVRLYRRAGIPRPGWPGWQDEGSPQPGDFLLVYESHISEPGLARALAGRQLLKTYSVDGIRLAALYHW